MRIAFVTSGAAGMFCGSCMRDNTLVAALAAAGHDALLVPTYTPIRTDEENVSQRHVFYGGINVYLEQMSWLFRHTPRFVDWLFNRPFLLKWATKSAATADYGTLADLTVSMLQGDHGRQRKELDALVHWLRADVSPDVVVLSNVLLSGLVPTLRRELGVPVLATLQGDDIFLDVLPEPQKGRCLELIRENDPHIDGYFSTSRYYADHMSGYLGVARGKMHVVWPGLNLKGHGGPRPPRGDRPPTVGYFARVCPEKGFHNLVDAFIALRQTPGAPAAVLRASGWLGEQHKPFLDQQRKKLAAAGLSDAFEYVDSPTHADKVRFLHGIDVLSVPTDYREPKGLYVLEAWANGVPVVQPAHGSFPELVEATGGGLVVEPGNPAALAAGLRRLLEDEPLRSAMGERGRAAVRDGFTAARMAAETVSVLNKYVRPGA
jgi:glycosyltransferase involved in cell wall biosynthesis